MCFIKLHLLALSDGLVLVMTNLSPGLHDQMEACGLSLEPRPSLHTFADFDRGVEWCENELLRAQGVDPRIESEAVAEMLTRELPDDVDAREVMAYMERRNVDEGRYLTRQGERADDLFFIESGQVTVLLALEEGAVVRLLTTGLGTIGEVGLYTGLERTASVVAEAPSVVYRLTLAALDRMEREDPRLAAAFHKFIARRLATRLADTTRVLREVLE
jgi:SulP family sulfate permease